MIPEMLLKEEKLPEQAVEVIKITTKHQKQNWEQRQKDFIVVSKLAEKHISILSFVEEYLLDLLHGSQAESTDDDDKVTIITIHSAKGTECETCYVVNVSPGSYPTNRAKDELFDEEIYKDSVWKPSELALAAKNPVRIGIKF
jgi:DNA helicase-2/ATP-dependent DNA helicase PcrA